MTSSNDRDDVKVQDLLSHCVKTSSQMNVTLGSEQKFNKALAKITDLPYGTLLCFSLQSILNTSKSGKD